ncbi:MAG: lipoprotein-releasing ABC transporter permease subunit [Pseudomonadota bacterium]
MLRPVELMIALRYLRARQSARFASFISFASLLGVAIGVAALITILSVMNGFEAELRERLLGMQSQATISAQDGRLDDWPSVREAVLQDSRVRGAAPVVTMEGMANVGGRLLPVLAEGLDPSVDSEVSRIASAMIAGSLEDLLPGARRIVIGRFLALDLGVGVGDDLVLLVPRPVATGVEPALHRLTVSGLFDSGVPEYDSGVAYLHWQDAADIAGLGEAVSGIKLRFDDVFAAGGIARELTAELGGSFRATDWTRENASYFRAIKLEKAMMAIILSLVIGVAAFNIVASLVMVVTDKETDIAILRTLGIDPQGVVRIFFIQGLIIGWLGVLLGVALGVALALNVTEVAAWLEGLLGFQVMPGDVYVMTRIPSEVHAINVVWIAVVALLATTIATIYPARRAASVHPAEALRYA